MLTLNPEELGAVLAGLRLLQQDLDADEPRLGEDPDLNAIYTVGKEYEGLTTEQIDALCERLNGLPSPASPDDIAQARELYASGSDACRARRRHHRRFQEGGLRLRVPAWLAFCSWA